jgi:putative SOS response-associated peptidase YedK
MCGRYALHTHPDIIALQFGVSEAPQMKPRFNIAPTQEAPVVRVRVGPEHKRELALLRWGLIPSWSKDASISARMIIARAETVAEKPSFRNAFRRRRCLVPTDGYYEWKVEAGRKQPYFLRLASGEPFAMAGLWEQWRSPEGKLIETYAIVTTVAAGTARQIHDRMPVILAQPEYEAWLCSAEPEGLLRPWAGAAFSVRRVSSRVNSPRFDDPQCLDEGGPGAVSGP